MHRVEKWSIEDNNWVLHSWHRNRDYAEIHAQVIEQAGGIARIINEGKIISEAVKPRRSGRGYKAGREWFKKASFAVLYIDG